MAMSPSKINALFDHPALQVTVPVRKALVCTMGSFTSTYDHLPTPVRFRASGATGAWDAALVGTPGLAQARSALADTRMSPAVAIKVFVAALSSHLVVQPAARTQMGTLVDGLLSMAGQMLCFWWRQGALYEPTLPLGNVLGGSDIAADLPLEWIRTPHPALAILPPSPQRHHCAHAQAVMVFEHAASEAQAPATRALTFWVFRSQADHIDVDQLVLPVKAESDTLMDTIARAVGATRGHADQSGFEPTTGLEQARSEWHQILDYTVKVLLYLRLDEVQLELLQPYTEAPKVFPGLGRKKQQLKLAAVEQLYDRYVVGPVGSLELGLPGDPAQGITGHETSAHWRRGHFRLQAHGPKAAMRKLMFIAPTMVRADKLPVLETGQRDFQE